MKEKFTKIVCTLGPSSDSINEITKLVDSGMNLARLNFSHGIHKEHKKLIENIRKVEKNKKTRIGIIQDLQGPKIRIGETEKEGIMLKKGQTVILTIEDEICHLKGKNAVLSVQYKEIIKDIQKGDRVLINDGLIELKAKKKSKTEAICTVITGGLVTSHKGINLPGKKISAKALTEKDLKDLKFGLKQKVDYIAISFVRNKKDITDLRKIIEKAGSNAKIIAKIERFEAIENLCEIIEETDALMVARGDLGVEIPEEQVPIIQKRLIKLANEKRKPVITATQVLDSMVDKPRATRAEISDAANAVYDRTDAIMLSNESAVGKYAHKAVETLKKVAIAVEDDLKEHKNYIKKLYHPHTDSPTDFMCENASKLAKDLEAKFLVVYTNSGYTAKEVTKSRLFTPIITITSQEHVARELTLVYSLNNILVKNISGPSAKHTKQIVDLIKKNKLVEKGDQIVIISNASRQEKLISTYKIQ